MRGQFAPYVVDPSVGSCRQLPRGAGRESEPHITKKKQVTISDDLPGAENETRTRDPNLGKVVLYQLSYFRKFSLFLRKNFYLLLKPVPKNGLQR